MTSLRFLLSCVVLSACGGSQATTATATSTEPSIASSVEESATPSAFNFVMGEVHETASQEPNDEVPVSSSEGTVSIMLSYEIAGERQEVVVDEDVYTECAGPYCDVVFDLDGESTNEELSAEYEALVAQRPDGVERSVAFALVSTRTMLIVNAYHVVRDADGLRVERQVFNGNIADGAASEVVRRF